LLGTVERQLGIADALAPLISDPSVIPSFLLGHKRIQRR
jgi:hypothetical protein